MPLEPPPFTHEVDRLLVRGTALVRALPAATPTNAVEERQRILDALARRSDASPRWTYAAYAVQPQLDEIVARAEALLPHGDTAPLVRAYRERLAELRAEAAVEEAVGTRRLTAAADARYAPLSQATSREADALADAWLNEAQTSPTATSHDDPLVRTDADDPDSLLSQMRAEVGRQKLPFRVVVHGALASLAATGSDSIFVTGGRAITRETARRTVLHEVSGHALPRARAQGERLGIFLVGTARGTDEQEGYALLLEERAGLLRGARRRELGARQLAIRAMRDGATFVEVVERLVEDAGLDREGAVRIGERTFRGSDGTFPGLGRERVYLEALVRVRAWLAAHPEDEAVLASGQVATGAVEALRPFCSG